MQVARGGGVRGGAGEAPPLYIRTRSEVLSPTKRLKTKGVPMTKEVVKHRKEDKKKPTMTPKERKAKKQEKKQAKKA